VVIGPSNIGDAVLAGEVIATLREAFPDAHLTLVVGERATALWAGDPRIHRVVDADVFSAPLARLRLALSLWRFHPQVVVDLRHTLYPLLLKPFAAWRYAWSPPKRIAHLRERYLWMLHRQVPGLGAAGAPGQGAVWVTAKEAAHVETLCWRWGVDGARPLILICPGARSHIKRWTSEGFSTVADRLIAEAGACVVFSGEPEEGPCVEEILGLMRQRAHSAVGLVTVRQAGALMQRARLVITNDSASLHLAGAFQVPTVAIFGPTDANRYGPTAPRHRTIRRRLFCAPCEQPLCRFHHECMRFISADDVYEAARQLLAGASASRSAAIQELHP